MAPSRALRVKFIDAETELSVPVNDKTTGQSLFDELKEVFAVREHWFFDISYTHSDGSSRWLKRSKKVFAQDIARQASPSPLLFTVKLAPADVATGLILSDTRHFFYRHVRQLILKEEFACPTETVITLAGLSAQIQFGDFDQDSFEAGCVSSKLAEYLPKRVTSQFQMSPEAWESRIVELYMGHRGLTTDDALLAYLRAVQNVPSFGRSFYETKDVEGALKWLGVDVLGIRIYNHDDKQTSRESLLWADMKTVTHRGQKFVLVPRDSSKHRPMVFHATTVAAGKNLSNVCASCQAYYNSTVAPETILVQQIRVAAKQEKQKQSALLALLRREQDLRQQVTQERDRLLSSQPSFQQINMIAQRAHDAEQAYEFLRREHEMAEADRMALEARALSAEFDLQRARQELARREDQCEELQETLQLARDAEAAAMEKLMRSSLPSSNAGSQIFSQSLLHHLTRGDSRTDLPPSRGDSQQNVFSGVRSDSQQNMVPPASQAHGAHHPPTHPLLGRGDSRTSMLSTTSDAERAEIGRRMEHALSGRQDSRAAFQPPARPSAATMASASASASASATNLLTPSAVGAAAVANATPATQPTENGHSSSQSQPTDANAVGHAGSVASRPSTASLAAIRDESLLSALEKENEQFKQKSNDMHAQLRNLRDQMTSKHLNGESSTDPDDDLVATDNNALAPISKTNPIGMRHRISFIEEI